MKKNLTNSNKYGIIKLSTVESGIFVSKNIPQSRRGKRTASLLTAEMGIFFGGNMRTHCIHGHVLKDNVYIRPNGGFVCRTCKKTSDYKYKKLHPWTVVLGRVNSRCSNKKEEFYYRYGGRGIKNLMTRDDFKFLWFRDKAHLMKIPSIDRIDNNGNYELSNCQFIEFAINSRKDKQGEKCCNTKLTADNVKTIRTLRKNGVRSAVLAEQFNVAQSNIQGIVRRRTWKHI